MAAVLFTLTVAFAVVSALQARAVALERDRARLEARRAERVSVLVADLFKLAEPGASTGQSLSARQLLDRGTARIASELAGDPGMQAALFNVVGRVYSNLALHDTAIAVLQRALALERTADAAGSLTQAETLHYLGTLYERKNDYPVAEPLFRQALAHSGARARRPPPTSRRRSKRWAAPSAPAAATSKRTCRSARPSTSAAASRRHRES